jgi:hypothetical protein
MERFAKPCQQQKHNTITACSVQISLKPPTHPSESCPDDDDPFIVLTETKFSFRCIPVGIGILLTGLGSTKNTCDNVLTMTSTVPW